MSEQQNVTVTILDKTYKIKCAPDRVAELRESVKYLDDKMREITHASKVSNSDRVVVIVALNLIHELLQQRRQMNTYIDAMSKRIQDLQSKIEAVLEQ